MMKHSLLQVRMFSPLCSMQWSCVPVRILVEKTMPFSVPKHWWKPSHSGKPPWKCHEKHLQRSQVASFASRARSSKGPLVHFVAVIGILPKQNHPNLVVTGTWISYFSRNSWEFHHPNWFIFFRWIATPPTRNMLIDWNKYFSGWWRANFDQPLVCHLSRAS